MSPIPMPVVAASNDDGARWQAWERTYMRSSRRAANHVRIAFAILLTGAAAWIAFQLLSMPV